MNTTKITAVIGGIALIVFVLWYFFSGRAAVAAESLDVSETREIN